VHDAQAVGGPGVHWAQESENEAAQVAVLCAPGVPSFVASLHPHGALFERPFNLSEACAHHAGFVDALRERGVRVHLVGDVLRRSALPQLRRLASARLHYRLSEDLDPLRASVHTLRSCSAQYKRQIVQAMDRDQLCQTVMLSPTVTLGETPSGETCSISTQFDPLGNTVFTRDQQIVTRKGLVMGRMALPQRCGEISVMELVFKELGIVPVGAIPAPFTLEGGDFLPAGPDLCFLGVGVRTSLHAALYMLRQDLFGTRRVALVSDYFERRQDRMHLDTVFNIASDRVCLMMDSMIGEDKLHRRLVTEYVYENGAYRLNRRDVEFAQYVRDEGYTIVPVTEDEQLEYVINFLNLGENRIICVHPRTKELLETCEQFDGEVTYIPFTGITNMYGAVHCSSQVFRTKLAAPPLTPSTVPSCKQSDAVEEAFPRASFKTSALPPTSAILDDSPSSSQSDRTAESSDLLAIPNFSALSMLSSSPHDLQLNHAANVHLRSLLKTRAQSPSSVLHLQTTNRVLMIVPTCFEWNSDTSSDNLFQAQSWRDVQTELSARYGSASVKSLRDVQHILLDQFSALHRTINSLGIETLLYTHLPVHHTPEACFPNNWLSTHAPAETGGEGTLILYPMRSETRRRERRHSIVSDLSELYPREVNLSKYELGTVPQFLEGMGSLVLDRVAKVAYAALSSRTYIEMVNRWAAGVGYSVVSFHAAAYHEEALDLTLPGTEQSDSESDDDDDDDEEENRKSAPESRSSTTLSGAPCPLLRGSSESSKPAATDESAKVTRSRCGTRGAGAGAQRRGRNLLRAGLLARMEAVVKEPSAVTAMLHEHDCALVHYTTLVLFIGSSLIVFCAEALYDERERAQVMASLRADSDRTLVLITEKQMANFCAQLIELRGHNDERVVLMSTGAEQAFEPEQLEQIRGCCDHLVTSDVGLFEVIAGASVSSLFAELF